MNTSFGTELRQWRRTRGLSQLDLASRAEVSQRHISFLETGRSKPSREMVLHLGRTMEIPPREQNLLLTAAGHTAAFSETPLDALSDIGAVLDRMLQAHEPNPAFVVDRQWNVVASNSAAVRFTALMFPEPPAWMTPPLNIMRLTFHPEGLRRHMVDWEQSATALLRRLERDAASYPNDEALQQLLTEVRSQPNVSALDHERRQPEAADLLVPFTYVIDGKEISLFTTIAVIGDAHDLTLAELRIETFWPMDQRAAERWLGFVG